MPVCVYLSSCNKQEMSHVCNVLSLRACQLFPFQDSSQLGAVDVCIRFHTPVDGEAAVPPSLIFLNYSLPSQGLVKDSKMFLYLHVKHANQYTIRPGM